MTKKGVRRIALLLAMLTLASFSACFNGLGGDSSSETGLSSISSLSGLSSDSSSSNSSSTSSDSSSSSSSSDETFTPTDEFETVEGTIHERYVGTTTYNLVRGGTTKYRLLIAADEKNLSAMKEAVSEFQQLFQEATGVTIMSQVDSGVAYNDTATYISLGKTNFLKSSGIEVDYATLGTQGYQLETKGKSIFVCGEPWGVLWGVYDLLKELVGYEMFTNKYYSINKNVETVKLPDLKVKEVPDILYRRATTGPFMYNAQLSHRMRMMPERDMYMTNGTLAQHNMTSHIVPLSQHYSSHSAWYSDYYDGEHTQLCYTAHGQPDEYELMVDTAIANVKSIILKNPEQDSLSLTQMDRPTWCDCETCQGLEDKYGTNAASQIRFVNDVVKEINVWLEEEQNGRKIDFAIFAYHKAELAPAVKNEAGEYKAIDETVVLDPSVSVWIAPIDHDYTVNTEHENSENFRAMFESWKACANSFWFWGYYVYFQNYMVAYDTYEPMQDLIQYCVKNDIINFWAQGNYNTKQNTGFDDLKEYLVANLLWNCNLKIGDLIDHYFESVYREAADIMQETFYIWRTHSKWQAEMVGGIGKYSTGKVLKAQYWPKSYLLSQLDRLEVAKTLIEKYKDTDAALYQQIHDSIVCESMTIRYCLIEYHGATTYDPQTLASMKAEFTADRNRLGFTAFAEGRNWPW